jgi:hypothetical protein
MYKKAILFHLFLTLISVTFSGCCEDVYTVTADFGVSFTNIPQAVEIIPGQDTIREPFIYSLGAVIVSDNSGLDDFGFMGSAYALSCSEVYLNGYRRETATLTLDRSFQVYGHNVPAGTNLLDLDPLLTPEPLHTSVYEFGISARFSENFLQHARFPLGNYTFIASVMMEDGTLVKSEDSIVLEINP